MISKNRNRKNFAGHQAGHLTALFKSGTATPDGNHDMWVCRCMHCGRYALASVTVLSLKHRDASCGCVKIARLQNDIKAIEDERRANMRIIEAFFAGRNILPEPEPTNEDLQEALLSAIEHAVKAGRPFTKTGRRGLWERRGELPTQFHSTGRKRIIAMADEFIRQKKITKFSSGSKKSQWLDVAERKEKK